ncbi:MAG: thioredoxin domain-containing protein [bacterium]|nr:thioredoxin domain-containing protein [bacterium]
MSDIAWMTWGEAAFARARTEDKPILLSISAVWCHWCHVMDDTSYRDPGVVDRINANYVPVRVDNDERPDINARYNMGGWPTTAFLAPDGTTLTGATYLPPAQMRRALDEIAQFYTEKKGEIAERAAEMRATRRTYEPSTPDALRGALVDAIAAQIADAYDEEFGGFGDAPKFPQPEALEFLLAEWRVRRDTRLHEMVARTMREMARGGMYDHVEGGFFRYSTTRDWSVPHFEKMSEDHAGLVRVLAQLQLAAPSDDWHAIARSALGYVRTVLRDPVTGFFAGSQDADEAYFALPLDERHARTAPFVDRRAYANWTSALAGAFAWASVAFDDDALAAEAATALDALHERMRDDDGLLYHVAAPGEAPRVRGLLADQSAYLRALLDLHEVTGAPRFLERARTHADLLIARFGATDGGFYDRADLEASIGRLELPDRPIIENGIVAESLLRLGAMTGDTRYHGEAERTLLLYARTHGSAGSFAATYARALRRYLLPTLSVRVTGAPERTEAFREAARRLPDPFTTVYADAAGNPAAYLCLGTLCAAPVTDAAELRAAYDALAV